MNKVAIIGAGMVGRLVAHACDDSGISYDMFTEAMPGPGFGVRYLHESCNLPLHHLDIHTYIMDEDGLHDHWEQDKARYAERYAKLVGSSPTNNSVHRAAETTFAYDWYDAFAMLEPHNVIFGSISRTHMDALSKVYEYVFSTIPLPVAYPEAKELCNGRKMLVDFGTPDTVPDGIADHSVIYNLTGTDWSRYSKMGSVDQYESLSGGAHTIMKVTGKANFKPPHDNVVLVGRYGAWDYTYMAHHAYYNTMEFLREAYK